MHESIVTALIRDMNSCPVYTPRPPAPVWQPPDEVRARRRAADDRPFPEHISALYAKCTSDPPSLKALCDAMKLDGYPPEKIKRARDHHAKMNRTVEQRQADLEKIFGRYNAKSAKPVKKVLKVVKKRNAAAE